MMWWLLVVAWYGCSCYLCQKPTGWLPDSVIYMQYAWCVPLLCHNTIRVQRVLVAWCWLTREAAYYSQIHLSVFCVHTRTDCVAPWTTHTSHIEAQILLKLICRHIHTFGASAPFLCSRNVTTKTTHNTRFSYSTIQPQTRALTKSTRIQTILLLPNCWLGPCNYHKSCWWGCVVVTGRHTK